MTVVTRRTRTSLRRTITIVALVGFALGALLAFGHAAVTRYVGDEAYKILLQFVMIVVLGGGVSLMYQEFNRDADRRAQRARQDEDRARVVRESRQVHLRDLVTQYNRVKRARRMLRAQALTHRSSETARQVKVARYDEYLQVVLDAQLSLETTVHVVKADDEVFPACEDLIAALDRAETYLHSLVSEYEKVMPGVHQDGATIDLSRLPVLDDFIGPYKESVGFRRQFVRPMQRSLRVVQRLVIGGT